jgi:uncharacterized protein DUF6894
MPRYYFHVRRGQVTFLDNEGIELTDIQEAATEGMQRGRAIARRVDLTNGVGLQAGSVVIDDEWRTVLELPLEE